MPYADFKSPLRVLVVEDNAADQLLICNELTQAPGIRFDIKQAQHCAQALDVLLQGPAFDVVLLSLTLPKEAGQVALDQLRAAARGVPIILLAQRADEALALQLVHAGAQDYWLKGSLDAQLVRAIRYAVSRAQSELALRVSERRWEFALEGAGEGVWDWDVAGQTVFYSPRWKAMLGYTHDEVGTQALEWRQRLHPDDEAAVMAKLQTHMDGLTGTYSHEHRLRCKDGSYLWVLGRGMVVSRDTAGKPLRMVGTNTDLTVRRAADEQMHMLETSLAHIDDVVLITSAETSLQPYPHIVYVNDAFERLTGYTRQEALGNSPTMLQGPLTQRTELDRIGAALKLWQPVRAELINYTKAGEAFWLEISITPLKDAKGWVTHWVAVERDISERKMASAQVQAAMLALQASQEQLQTLSRRILKAQETERRRVALELHDELGQALTAVKINLLSRAGSSAGSAAALQAENVRIVEDALQQVRRLALALRPSMLDDLGLEAALTWLAQSASSNRDVTINLHCSMASERVAPDIETACFRIVQESLTNIRRHARAKNVNVTLVVDADSLELTVQDDGTGFDIQQPRHHSSEGFSLGLLGIRERALGIGGDVTIVSAPGEGCTVRLSCALDASPMSIL